MPNYDNAVDTARSGKSEQAEDTGIYFMTNKLYHTSKQHTSSNTVSLDHLAPFLFFLAQVLVLAPLTIGHYTANILQTQALTDHRLEIILLL